MSKRTSRIAAISVLFALASCGGGGGGGSAPPPPPPPPPPATAEGAYAGTLTGGTYNAFQMVVLENDEYWSVYGNLSGGTLFAAGFTHGDGTTNGTQFTSSNLRDYSLAGVLSGSVDGTFVTGTSVGGVITYPGLGNVLFNGTAAAIAPYDYSLAANLADITGSWNFTALDGSLGVATINSNGTYTTVSGGCTSTGTIQPRASGKNIFDVTLQVGGPPCLTPGFMGTGIGIYSPILNSSLHQLIVGAVSADKSMGTMVFGAR